LTRGDDAVLVVGVYLVDHENTAVDIVEEFSHSHDWAVEQRWVALGRTSVPSALATVTVENVETPAPKFTLLNRVLSDVMITKYAFVIVCDDDIAVPADFIDRYLRLVRAHDFALAQPARTHDSYIDHPFVEQLDGINARRTRFVEIGPLVSVRRDAAFSLLPFDELSPMGWGYDLVWPYLLERVNLKLGIIDATPVAHRLRKPVAHYKHEEADRQMQRYLHERPHLSKLDAFRIIESYV
jgi:hypothetical protein